MFTHFSPKTTIFALLRGHFWPKTWKIKCFQFIQSKISQFGTQMWLPKKLQFLVPGTPPEPPIPPLTPPRGPGGPKMAKMHSLKSNNDNQCQKSHFRGVKNFDLFFHLECPTCKSENCGQPSKVKSPPIITTLIMTWCQILCTMRLQRVSKILTPRRMLQKT